MYYVAFCITSTYIFYVLYIYIHSILSKLSSIYYTWIFINVDLCLFQLDMLTPARSGSERGTSASASLSITSFPALLGLFLRSFGKILQPPAAAGQTTHTDIFAWTPNVEGPSYMVGMPSHVVCSIQGERPCWALVFGMPSANGTQSST